MKECPICKHKNKWGDKSSNRNGVLKHIIQKARQEVWQNAVRIDEKIKTPHFDFYMKNTKEKNIVGRTWDYN